MTCVAQPRAAAAQENESRRRRSGGHKSELGTGPDEGLEAAPEEVREISPRRVGLALMKHAYSGFSCQSRFLGSRYVAEEREAGSAPS